MGALCFVPKYIVIFDKKPVVIEFLQRLIFRGKKMFLGLDFYCFWDYNRNIN